MKSDLCELKKSGAIDEYGPEEVKQILTDAGVKKSKIRGILDNMRRNNERLIHGQIPASMIKMI